MTLCRDRFLCPTQHTLISGVTSCLTIMHRKHAPFAWCDCVKVYCAVNNQVETFIEQRRKILKFSIIQCIFLSKRLRETLASSQRRDSRNLLE